MSDTDLFRLFIEALRLVSTNGPATIVLAVGLAIALVVVVIRRKGPPKDPPND